MKKLTLSLGLAATATALSGQARADVSSWAFMGSGATQLQQRSFEKKLDPTILVETGLGTPPTSALVLGGMFKLHGYLGDGADLGLSLRLATRGFVTGGFGL